MAKSVSSEYIREILVSPQNELCTRQRVSVDALRPHVSARTWSRFAALRPETGC